MSACDKAGVFTTKNPHVPTYRSTRLLNLQNRKTLRTAASWTGVAAISDQTNSQCTTERHRAGWANTLERQTNLTYNCQYVREVVHYTLDQNPIIQAYHIR